MFITKQHNGEIEKFIEEQNPYVIEIEYDNMTDFADIRKTVAWCQENFIGDGGGKIQSRRGYDNYSIKWYMVDESDYVAFKLKWL